MDARSRKPAERWDGHERDTGLRRAVEQVRSAPPPADALTRALEQARRLVAPRPRWRGWLIRGEVGRN